MFILLFFSLCVPYRFVIAVFMMKWHFLQMFMLAGRKRKKSATSNYLFSTDPTNLARQADSYCGKLRYSMMLLLQILVLILHFYFIIKIHFSGIFISWAKTEKI